MRVQLKKLKSDHISNILESIDAYVARAVDGGTFLDSIGDSSQLEDIIMDPSWQDFVNELEVILNHFSSWLFLLMCIVCRHQC